MTPTERARALVQLSIPAKPRTGIDSGGDCLLSTVVPDMSWYHHAALDAIDRGHFLIITGRNHADPYLLRCWLTPPKTSNPTEKTDERQESGASVLLHLIARPDDDEALHDHPWSFRTTILAGGYDEEIPDDTYRDYADLDEPGHGPTKTRTVTRHPGDTIFHTATDLHRIRTIHGACWTLVSTYTRCRNWGFHPPGQPWIPFADFLAAKKDRTQPQSA